MTRYSCERYCPAPPAPCPSPWQPGSASSVGQFKCSSCLSLIGVQLSGSSWTVASTRTVLSGAERTGPPDGSPARVAPTGRVAAGGAWQTNAAANRRILPANLNRRRWTCRGQYKGLTKLRGGHGWWPVTGTGTERNASPALPGEKRYARGKRQTQGTKQPGCVDAAQPLGSDVRAHGEAGGRSTRSLVASVNCARLKRKKFSCFNPE